MKQEEINILLNIVNSMKGDIASLLQQQQISNLIAISNNPNVPTEVQQKCLTQAMDLMGLPQIQSMSPDALDGRIL